MNDQHSSSAKPLLAILIAAVAVVGLGGVIVWGIFAGRGEATAEARREQSIKPAVRVSRDGDGAPVIALGPDLQRQAGIRTVPPRAASYRRQIQAYGSVLDLQPFTDLGNTVANAKARLAIAQARLAASRAAFERAQTLHENGENVSTARLQAAEATYRSDEASARAAQVQARNAVASAYQAWGPVLGRSLAEGRALAGDLVQRKKVLVQVTLPLGLSLAQAPQKAAIETTTGQRVAIELISRATRTDPRIQGVSFFYAADAASGVLPGMNVIAFLFVGKPVPGVTIPDSAVVWLQGRAWVYLQTAANAFSRRAIPTTEPQPGGGYVVPALGLPTNELLVVNGAQALLSQEFSAQIQLGGD